MSIATLLQEMLRLSEKLTRLTAMVGEMQRRHENRLKRLEERLDMAETKIDTQGAQIGEHAIVPRLKQTARIVWPPVWKAGALVVLLYADSSVVEIQTLVSMLLK